MILKPLFEKGRTIFGSKWLWKLAAVLRGRVGGSLVTVVFAPLPRFFL